jgi:hypothetical protein
MNLMTFRTSLLFAATSFLVAGGNVSTREELSNQGLVDICHHSADLRQFEKISVSANTLAAHIGRHDVTVEQANALAGTQDCECLPGYTGDGVNCIVETPLVPLLADVSGRGRYFIVYGCPLSASQMCHFVFASLMCHFVFVYMVGRL